MAAAFADVESIHSGLSSHLIVSNAGDVTRLAYLGNENNHHYYILPSGVTVDKVSSGQDDHAVLLSDGSVVHAFSGGFNTSVGYQEISSQLLLLRILHLTFLLDR